MNERIDLLNREKFIKDVVQVVCQLSENKKGSCFAIEAGWGIGKTFVVEAIEERLRIIQSEKTMDDRFFVFHYNCWQHDYYDEPAIAIISAMQASIIEDEGCISREVKSTVRSGYGLAEEKLKEIVGLYLENKIGINLIEWIQRISDDKKEKKSSLTEFDELFNFSQTIEKVRKNLEEIAKERTVVLVVDELDRCIPEYAIKVMERLHHIFYGLENVVVIMAIDRSQLEHSVEKMFGIRKDGSFSDVEKYLKKFIDFSMLLDNGTTNGGMGEKYNFYFDRFAVNQKRDMENVYEILSTFFIGIDIRRVEKIIEKANIVHSIVCHEEKDDISVLVFEIMYEVMKLKKFTTLKYVICVNNTNHTRMMEALGEKRMKLLKKMEKESWHGRTIDIETNEEKKNILFNLYGKVIWYFANIFNVEDMPYTSRTVLDVDMIKGLETAKKYCQFCAMIQ